MPLLASYGIDSDVKIWSINEATPRTPFQHKHSIKAAVGRNLKLVTEHPSFGSSVTAHESFADIVKKQRVDEIPPGLEGEEARVRKPFILRPLLTSFLNCVLSRSLPMHFRAKCWI